MIILFCDMICIMASTRNKNMRGDYDIQQQQWQKRFNEVVFINSSSGVQETTHFPGDGLGPAKIPHTKLSSNSCDIESELRGIRSTDFTQVFQKTPINHELQQLSSLHMFSKSKSNVMPAPLVIERHQRPALFGISLGNFF